MPSTTTTNNNNQGGGGGGGEEDGLLVSSSSSRQQRNNNYDHQESYGSTGGGGSKIFNRFAGNSGSESNNNESGNSGRLSRSSLVDSFRTLSSRAMGSIHTSLRFGGRQVSIRALGGHSTISKSSFNLIKNLVGAGVLALPSGVASFANTPSAVVPASLWILVMGIMFAYSFQLIGKICGMTLSVSFREVWEDTMGYQGAFVVSLTNMLKPGLGNLAYSMILADTFRSLFITFLPGIGENITRTTSLLIVTFCGILPLCLLKNLDALAPFSIFGTIGILWTCIVMGIRYFDGTYSLEGSGIYLQDIEDHLQPSFGDYNGAWTGKVLVFAAMAFEAFVAHYNAPRFMAELKDANMTRFRIVVSNAFGFASFVYIIMTAFGFLTFGANCDGYILNNYSTNDQLATSCRVAIAFSILFTYPITFMGFRDGLIDVLDLPQEKQTSTNINILTVILLTIVTVLAAFFHDLGFINAVGGGTLATLIVFVFPPLMYNKAVYTQIDTPTVGQKREVKFAFILMVIGCFMGVVGVIVELQHQ